MSKKRISSSLNPVTSIIFLWSIPTGSEQTMQAVVQEINNDYESRINTIKNDTTYGVLEMSGSRAVWKEVLAVYSVKVNTDPDNPQEVATMDASKKATLKEIFWAMNNISSRTASKTENLVFHLSEGNSLKMALLFMAKIGSTAEVTHLCHRNKYTYCRRGLCTFAAF